MRVRFVGPSVVAVVALGWAPASARDDPDAKRRLDQMRAAVVDLEPVASELNAKDALAVVPAPLLRYSDPTRGGVKTEDADNVLLDAGLWRLGTTGRPTAIITAEIYQYPTGARVMSVEFLSLTAAKFSLEHKTEAVRWDATAAGVAFRELADAPKPAGTPAGRLAQMRQLARRFAATEQHNGRPVECRLIAKPIDRYQSEADKIADGAVFAYANGTNPEIGVVLETDGGGWRYGVIRLSSAASSVALDGKTVATFDQFNARGRRDGPYNSGSYKLAAAK